MMAKTIPRETKRGRPKNRQKLHNSKGPKKGKELVSLMVGNYLTHGPFYVITCKLWDLIIVGGLEQASFANAIFLSIAKAKAHWRTILTCCLKNWMQKDKDKWPLDCLWWKRRTHFLMKQSISQLGAPCTSMAIEIKRCPFWNLLYLGILAMV